MTIEEKRKAISYAISLNRFSREIGDDLGGKQIPIETYAQILEYLRLRLPELVKTIDGVKVRRRTKRLVLVGEIGYTKNIAIVPISKGKEAYFKLIG